MGLPETLARKKPSDFRTKRIKARIAGDAIVLNTIDPGISFGEMMALRAPADSYVMQVALKEEGHEFANYGLSARLAFMLHSDPFLGLPIQVRKDGDFMDTVAKYLSGYVPEEKLKNPRVALDDEIAEELLLCQNDGRVLPGFRMGRRVAPFFADAIEYADNNFFELTEEHDLYQIPDALQRPIEIDGQLLKGNPCLYFHSPTNSIQIVYDYLVNISDTSQLTMNHSEDIFNKKTQELDVRVREEGMLLVRLGNQELTRDVYTYAGGELKRYRGNILLSEAFLPKPDGIARENNLSLEAYLGARKI